MKEILRYWKDTYTECLINGQKIKYDGCSSRSLEESKTFYKGYYYIGSNNGTIFVNGTRNEFNTIHHFFAYDIKIIRKLKAR